MIKYILGQSMEFTFKDLPISQLKFWHENPRVYSEVYSMYERGDQPEEENEGVLQEKIYKTLCQLDNIRRLRANIEHAGGLTEAIIVRKREDSETYDVLEGNRRLAACRMILDKSDESVENIRITLRTIPCEVAPVGLPEEHVFALLGNLHLHGKSAWSPFAKASYIKRRYEKLNCDVDRVAREINDGPKEVKRQIDNIKLMHEFEERDTDMYSFYDVLHLNRNSKDAINESDFKKQKLVKEAREWRNEKRQATEFRKALSNMYKDRKVAKKFFNGEQNFSLEEASEEAIAKGSTDVILNRLKKFRTALTNDKTQLLNLDHTEPKFKKAKFEIDKLNGLVSKIYKSMTKGD